MPKVGQGFFFYTWTSKVPVNLHFSEMFTGMFLRSRALFGKVHGQVFAFTGRFLDIFTGTFHGSRAQFFGNVHGHFSRFTGTFSSNVPKMPELTCSRALFASSRALFSKNVHGHFWGSRALFWVHGHFFEFTGKIFFKSSRATSRCSRALFSNCSRALFKCSRVKKKTLTIWASNFLCNPPRLRL